MVCILCYAVDQNRKNIASSLIETGAGQEISKMDSVRRYGSTTNFTIVNTTCSITFPFNTPFSDS